MINGLNKNLCKLSGEDYQIIELCNPKIQERFARIGFVVFCILVFSTVSSYYFLSTVFDHQSYLNIVIDLGLTAFWNFVVINIYLLLLYTLSPTLIPGRDKSRIRKKMVETQWDKFLSIGMRIFFIGLIGLLVAKPFELELMDMMDCFSTEEVTFSKKIQCMNEKYPFMWFVTLAIIAAFLYPIYLKFRMRKLPNYKEFFVTKREIEKKIVINNYAEFKNNFKRVIKRATTKDIEYYEHWQDPPFNLISKENGIDVGAETVLLDNLYNTE